MSLAAVARVIILVTYQSCQITATYLEELGSILSVGTPSSNELQYFDLNDGSVSDMCPTA